MSKYVVDIRLGCLFKDPGEVSPAVKNPYKLFLSLFFPVPPSYDRFSISRSAAPSLNEKSRRWRNTYEVVWYWSDDNAGVSAFRAMFRREMRNKYEEKRYEEGLDE
jgi:hypothetical protein